MKKSIFCLLILFTLPVLADNCVISADLVVSFKGATTISCKANHRCITKQVKLPFKLYLQSDDVDLPISSTSYLSTKDLPIKTCYKNDFTITNGKFDKKLISLESILGKRSDERDKRKPAMRFTEEGGDETLWLSQSTPDIKPPVLSSTGDLFIIRQGLNDNKEKGHLYSFNIREGNVKFKFRESFDFSYGFDNSFYIKDDPLFEKHKEFDDENVLVLGKYGDDRVFVKIDDENKTDKTYQTCLYSFSYNLSKGAYDFTKKDCVIYKDYIINQDLYNKTYGLNKE